MSKSSSSAKRQKTASSSRDDPRITDPRFANIQSDPRFRLPGRKNKVKLDKRFSRVLEDEDFTKRAKVDRYGRRLENNVERTRLKRKYEFDEDDEQEKVVSGNTSDEDEPDDDDEVQRELQRVDNSRDLLRQGHDSDASSLTSSDESSSSDDDDEDDEGAADQNKLTIGPTSQSDIPMGEVTSRIAVVNLDWDNIRAADIMAVINSFLPANGSLLKVSIYPSEFGKERLEREEMEGPPKEIFAAKANETHDNSDDDSTDEEDGSDEESKIKETLLAPDTGDEFDSAALRRYQLDRLRYYYCVLTFSSPTVAEHVYSAVDGTEYLTTANFFDLRFVPDDTDFSSDIPKEECTNIPDDYRPNDFVTDALQHSKVRLTWDADDGGRKETIARAFKGGRKEIDENDLKAYLASDSSSDEEDGGADGPQATKKEIERQKMRAALGLAPEPVKKSSSKGDKKEKAPVGGMQITFTSGFSAPTEDNEEDGSKKQRRNKGVFENSPEPDETTVEKYVRKERERKQRRKDKAKSNNQSDAVAVDDPTEGTIDESHNREQDDLGFDDPFFASAAAAEPSAQEEKAASNRLRKEERLKKKKEREAEEEAEKKQRAELELLMVDDDATADPNANGKPGRIIQHFDMKEIERAEKLARKKGKAKTLKQKGQNQIKAGDEAVDDAFRVDTSDPRFARLFDSHEYAIDPTNPRFKATKGMREVLDEGRRRRDTKQAQPPGAEDISHPARDGDGKSKKHKDKNVKSPKSRGSDEGGADVRSLVAKIKMRNQK
ncbi:uncharacterized protein A1O9_10364 [Exophiala aquamarina CBS 119918]|uniref:Uncharacterized protein n=1 Tax=Exophiala aquamarina CBS 119918 TaxID=1182545 RepID=A0A072NZV5_9EURO|nr:uncharacterized protein A1O9_10364 [Exophiala aquamarina CBS 119918]KEF53389.1 hypothetical protein A1O9_10364 [Exophiala aquamarina CBS 119918]